MAETRRLITREMNVDLQELAGSMLIHEPSPREEVLEVYRWIAVTAGKSGRRWRSRDGWSHQRYPGIRDELGLRQWSTYPTNEDEYSLCFTRRSFEFMPKVRETIVRAVFGNGPQLKRWRKDHGLRPTIPCRIYKRADLRGRDPLYEVYSTQPGRWIPHVKEPIKLRVSLNKIHPRCRDLFAFVLTPNEDGWRLAVSFGQRERHGCSEWRFWADKWGTGEHHDIPTQGPNEGTNAFLERVCDYARSILKVELPPPRTSGEAAARATAERDEGLQTFAVGRRFFAARSQEHAEAIAQRSMNR